MSHCISKKQYEYQVSFCIAPKAIHTTTDEVTVKASNDAKWCIAIDRYACNMNE